MTTLPWRLPRASFLTAVLAAMLALAACSGGSGDGTKSGGSGPETKDITVGMLPVVDVAPLYVAQKAGYFAAEGLTVKFQPAQGGAALIPAAVSGQVQVVFSNYVSLFLAKSNGIDLKVIAEANRAAPGFSGVLVLPGSPISTAKDLAGRKVAVNSLNNVGDVAVRSAVKAAGGDPAAVQFVELAFPDMGPALQKGQIDAAWVVEPFTSGVTATLKARKVVDPFGGETDALPVAGYAVTKKFADANPNTVAAFRRALAKGAADAKADKAKVAAVLPEYTKLDAAKAAGVTPPEFVTATDVKQLQRVSDLMSAYGKLKQPLDVAGFTDAG